MRARALLLATALLVSSSLTGSPAAPVAPASPAPDADVAAGIALVREGDFEAAILKLDAAARRLQADRARQKEAVQALVYLGVAYLELDQEPLARGKFQAALALDPQLRLDPRQFSPQQIRLFDSVRPSGPTSAAGPGPSPSPGARTTPASPKPVATTDATGDAEKKKKKSPLVWILGGGAVIGGAAALAGGGGGGGAQPTTTTPVGVGSSTTTSTPASSTTTVPGPPDTTVPGNPTTTTTATTTLPGTPSTTVPPTTTLPTTTTTSSTTTTTTTTTTPPACSYTLTPPTQQVVRLGGSGTCQIDTNLQSCAWTVESSDDSWLHVTGSPSGTGDGSISFNAGPNGLNGARSARLRLVSDPGNSCTVTQPGLLGVAQTESPATFVSELDLDGGEGQVVVDGSTATFQRRGASEAALPEGRALHRIEATVVSADGRAGTWRFRLGAVAPGTLRIVAGNGTLAGDDGILFRLTGKPGERLVFAFRNH